MKILFSLFIAILFSTVSYGQTKVSFCTAVHENNCIFGNSKFIAQQDSLRSTLFIFVQNDNGFNSSKLVYRIFGLNKDGSEKLMETFEQFVQKDWVKAWMPYYFPTGSKYKVEITNEANEKMTNNTFELLSY